jgi:hypothetical protein
MAYFIVSLLAFKYDSNQIVGLAIAGSLLIELHAEL